MRRAYVTAVAGLALASTFAQAQVAVSPNGRFAEIGKEQLYYVERGQGAPLILLHNFFNTGDSWSPYLDALAADYRVVVLDLPGHGRSVSHRSPDTFLHAEAATDLLGLMDRLGIERTRAIGASSGGMVLLHAATMQPNRFEALVLIGAQTYSSSKARAGVAALSDSLDADPEPLNKTHGVPRAERLRRQFRAAVNQYGDLAFTPDLLATISARTLVVQGDNDRLIPISQPLDLFQAIPGAHLWIVPNGGHLPHLVPENRDDFLRRVTAFLAGTWKEEPR